MKIKSKIGKNPISRSGGPPSDLFNDVVKDVINDLRLDVFPRFCRSEYFRMYLKCKRIENANITIKDFNQMRMLGSGAFGCVNACKKRIQENYMR